jgi:hypothetical protein
MGRESTSYHLTLPAVLADAVVVALRESGAELVATAPSWIELRLREPYRYWIDLRVHRAPEARLEIRIALTNDEWSIRVPLETAFSTLPEGAAQGALRDEDGGALGTPADDRWSRRLEEDYGRRRADFVAGVGEINAPISADHVYMHIHQTRVRRDDDRELEWQRDREIARMQAMWDGRPEHPTDRAGAPPQDAAGTETERGAESPPSAGD